MVDGPLNHKLDHPRVGLVLGLFGMAGIGLTLMAPTMFWLGAAICCASAMVTAARYRGEVSHLVKSEPHNLHAIELVLVPVLFTLEIGVPAYLIWNRPSVIIDSKIGLSCRHFGGPIPPIENGNPAHVITFTERVPIPIGFVPTPDQIDDATKFSAESAFLESDDLNSLYKTANFRNKIRCEFTNYAGLLVPNAAALFLVRLSRVTFSSMPPSEAWVFATGVQPAILGTLGVSVRASSVIYLVSDARDVIILTKPVEVGSCEQTTHKIKSIPILQEQRTTEIYLFPLDAPFTTVPVVIHPSPTQPKLPERILPQSCP